MAKLFFRYSAMNAGKSTSLLQIAYNYEEQGQTVQLFTAGIDDRSGHGSIASRLGIQRQAQVFDATTDFLALLTPQTQLACVLIDESQFLTPAQVRQLLDPLMQRGQVRVTQSELGIAVEINDSALFESAQAAPSLASSGWLFR